jgi:predicted dienelactone hydrolase
MKSSPSLFAALLPLFLVPGCATHAPPPVDTSRVKQFAGRGYLTDNHFSIATTFSRLTVGEHTFDMTWNLPVTGSVLPVVVYLPGLGESRSAGEGWRTAWAQAGYAVLSVQLLDDDQKAWSSAAARRGDFVVLARERYGAETANARLNALATLLGELRQSHGTDEATLRRLDLSRVAIAGFDVGAYTSMLVAGETPKGSGQPARLPIAVAAIIALSPSADFSGSGLSSRYQSIMLPVLSVSGDADSDAAGIVSSPSLRRAPFEYMPSPDSYLLWLTNATHSVFSGSSQPAAEELAETGAGRRNENQGAHKGDGGRREGRRGGGAYPENAGANGDMAGAGDGRLAFRMVSPTDRALHVSLIQGITTAFLDTYMKQDAIAREWLQKDAGRWIGDRGELRRK